MNPDQKTLVIVFGGMDYDRIQKYDCSALKQRGIGRTDISQFSPREPSIIMASLITGKGPSEHGVTSEYIIENSFVRAAYNFMRSRSESTRRAAGSVVDVKKRRPIASDLAVPTIFDEIEDSRPLFIPSYNPEIGWCVDRNVLNPLDYPELGTESAEELLEKNFEWRKRRCLAAIEEETSFVMCHFQKIDSVHHLYYKYNNEENRIKQAYRSIDSFAGKLRKRAQEAGFERIDYLSEHGLPRDDSLKHEDSGFYSSNIELNSPKITEFYNTWF